MPAIVKVATGACPPWARPAKAFHLSCQPKGRHPSSTFQQRMPRPLLQQVLLPLLQESLPQQVLRFLQPAASSTGLSSHRLGFFSSSFFDNCLSLFNGHFRCSCFDHLIHSIGEGTGHVLGLSLSFNCTLNHLVSFLDGLVEVFEQCHVSNVPVVSSFHFRNSEFEVIVKFFCNSEDLAETVLLT